MGTYQTNKISLSVFDDKRLSMHKNANQTKTNQQNKIKQTKKTKTLIIGTQNV